MAFPAIDSWILTPENVHVNRAARYQDSACQLHQVNVRSHSVHMFQEQSGTGWYRLQKHAPCSEHDALPMQVCADVCGTMHMPPTLRASDGNCTLRAIAAVHQQRLDIGQQ
jgi:hypothetical protein